MTVTAKATAVAALAALLCVAIFSFRSIAHNEEDRRWVTHTHLVIEELQKILTEMTQAESGQRGYILTGQELYLAPYRRGITPVRKDLEDLRNLTSDNATQQQAIDGLEPLIAERISALADRVEIRKQKGLIAGAEAVASGNDGESLMTQIRDRLNKMQLSEEDLLSVRVEKATASDRRMKTIIFLGTAFALIFLAAAGVVIDREAVRRRLAEQGLNEINRHLEQRSRELMDANTEMESFSYSVAHDLRAPLRQIAGYSNILLQDYGSRLDLEAKRYLEKVGEGAARMGCLVDDLLGLSKIGRHQLMLEDTSLDKLVRQALAELEPQYAGREIDWQIAPLFRADCDPGLMKQVFVNLLSNAVKYSNKKEHAVIRVGQIKDEGRRGIFVQDNGAGFDMQYVDKLFGIFQRLHKARDFEGTGVGLAIVQRIIRKHGGRIWAEAKLDQGATFFFTLGSARQEISTEPEVTIDYEEMHA